MVFFKGKSNFHLSNNSLKLRKRRIKALKESRKRDIVDISLDNQKIRTRLYRKKPFLRSSDLRPKSLSFCNHLYTPNRYTSEFPMYLDEPMEYPKLKSLKKTKRRFHPRFTVDNATGGRHTSSGLKINTFFCQKKTEEIDQCEAEPNPDSNIGNIGSDKEEEQTGKMDLLRFYEEKNNNLMEARRKEEAVLPRII